MGLFKHKKENSEEEAKREILNEEKKDMIRGIEDLSETSVKEVMVPRIDVDFININTPGQELLEKIAASGHSRFPVYADSIDNVVGVLYVKDMIRCFSKNEEIALDKIIRKAFFVPESKRIDSLLREFKRRHVHIALAVDEYGGISGIVCMEDIIPLGPNAWLCDARTSLDDLNETIEANFPVEDFDTLGGFVFDLFGKIPVKYEKHSWNNYDFIVQDMEGHRINVIKVILKSGENNDGGKKESDE